MKHRLPHTGPGVYWKFAWREEGFPRHATRKALVASQHAPHDIFKTPFAAIERCVRGAYSLEDDAAIADHVKAAILALIGNSHVTRLFVNAVETGDAWTWRGAVAADEPGLDALTGGRSVEATVPGAGSVILNASPLPGELIDRCRERQRAKERAEQPAQDREEPQA